jgi:peptidoglycan/LPS O-acetylase OafA/YrhL
MMRDEARQSNASEVRPRLEWLTAVRPLLAFWIVLRHLSNAEDNPAAWILDYLPLDELRRFDIPITAFLVLSGIMFGSGRSMSSESGSWKSFWIARLARLYPLYLLTLLLCSPRAWIKSGGDAGAFAVSFIGEALFAQGWFPSGSHVHANPVGWFMSSIVFCFIVYPTIRSWLDGLSARSIVLFATAISGILALIGLLGAHGGTVLWWWNLRQLPIISVPAFCLGVALGMLIRSHRTRELGIALLVGATLAVVAVASFPEKSSFLMVTAPLLAFPLILLARLRSTPPRWLLTLGDMAFGIYLFHWTLHLYLKPVMAYVGLGALYASPTGLVLYLATLLFLAAASRRCFELPMQNFILRKLSHANSP